MITTPHRRGNHRAMSKAAKGVPVSGSQEEFQEGVVMEPGQTGWRGTLPKEWLVQCDLGVESLACGSC